MSDPSNGRAGLTRVEIAAIRRALAVWPGNWALDVVDEPAGAAVVLIAAEGDRFAPTLHLERCGRIIVVAACLWDEMTTVGQFASVTAALTHLAAALARDGGFSAALN